MWENKKIGDVVDIRRGASPRPIQNFLSDKGMPWVKIADATSDPTRFISHTNECIIEAGIKKSVVVEPETLIVSNSATPGLPKIMKILACVHDGWLVFSNYRGITRDFLYYKFIDIRRHLVNQANGSVFQNLKTDIVRDFDIAVPSIETQEKIVGILSALDHKIETNIAINDNLQQQAATIFHRWFVNNPDSEKWPMVTLDDLTSLVSRGIAPKYDDESAQIVLNQKCIRDHYIDISLGRRHKPKAINEKWLQYGDLLINSTGEGTLGRAAQVWFIPENMTVDSHVTVVRPMNQLLLFYIGLWGISHEREIEALHTGSTGQTELPRERVKAMELRLPDNDTLVRFNAVISPMASAIIANQKENTRMASIRDALLPKLMSGEIDVSSVDI